MKHRILMSLILGLFLVGCSSSKNKAESSGSATSNIAQPGPVAPSKMDLGDDEALVASRQAPPPAEAPKISVDELKQALQTGNNREVERLASRMLANNPKDVRALNSLATVYLRTNKPGMVRLLSKRVLEVDPKNATALNHNGVAFLLENEEARAIGEFRKAVEADRRNLAAATNLGSLHAKYRNFEKAKDVMEEVYSSGKASTILANNYGVALRGVGEFKAARRVFEDAIERDGRNVSLLLNYAILMVDSIGDRTKGQEAINRLKLLATDPAIMDRARQLEAKLK